MKKNILILISMFTLLLSSINYTNAQTSCNQELFKVIQKISTPKNTNELLKYFTNNVNFLNPPEVFFKQEFKQKRKFDSDPAKLSKQQITQFIKSKKLNSIKIFFFKDLVAEKKVLVNENIQEPGMCFINGNSTQLTVKFVKNNWYFISFGYVPAG